ncbi:ribosome biogenesis factor YjgA [Natronospira bacteriovora]|uniref:Ribosome biogenesis factor YjgA n=1 Tax=Natronospira bacteriovora TaxID=3069753 RepID=A0ABU0W871_9GAMM|nr:ribosome biogenesis factor YjgA [Natronospira sp. AB-CW4]MDQ2069943.1 ribosome biogenesis factor YjgA [Natronospira sp. AB-CW4]
MHDFDDIPEREPEDGGDAERRPSRSQLKREAEAREKLGMKLSALPDSVLEELSLPVELLDSLKRIRTMRRGGGLRRERQRIGALMRKLDPAPIEALLARLESEKIASAKAFHHLEQWRQRLLNGDESAFLELANASNEDTVKEARKLVEHAEQELIHGQPPAASRALFRLLRDRLDIG